MKFGNECYTWFMKESGAYWNNKLDHMIEVTAKAGMTGIEPMHFWMGDLADPEKLAESLKRNGIELAAIALVQDWNLPEETEKEITEAAQTIELLKQFQAPFFAPSRCQQAVTIWNNVAKIWLPT